ncbi:cysteine peptidase family C39 domain-containing protein [Methylophaga sp.]|uniref:cysteine peptidase family C39 domain-containing protein n=1 Tax=Methylophaga sp. TaxID=2024840 RepID=UPI00271E5C3D|nr:cysteine peptidase family C39 domain-containing protein [Methylophaga sp.]MDO8825728.1 cysteine peptidase family C39 domain-containing protein [Methylophaga sp.]
MEHKATNQHGQNRQWEAEATYLTHDDPLLACLTVLTKLLQKPHSPDSMVAGLPLVDNRLTPDLFSRAAERAGLSSKVVKRPLRKISPLVLPAVLLMNEGNACILVKLNGKQATVIYPESGETESLVDLADLQTHYTGYAIFIKAVQHFDKRGEVSSIPRARHWFWGTLTRFWRLF